MITIALNERLTVFVLQLIYITAFDQSQTKEAVSTSRGTLRLLTVFARLVRR